MNTHHTTTHAGIALAAVLAIGSVFTLPTASAFAAPDSAVSQADHAQIAAFASELASLQKTVSDQQKQILADHSAIGRLEARVAASALSGDPSSDAAGALGVPGNFGPFNVVGNDVYLTGYNLHIRSGTGATNGPINGLGNLIIGYDEARAAGNVKIGSHNLIIGSQNNYGSFAGIVAGFNNMSIAPYASVTGGEFNVASGEYASVTGGNSGFASGVASTVTGGFNNYSKGPESAITGGWNGLSNNSCTQVSGGFDNSATGTCASVQGGYLNTASGFYSSVSGGYDLTEANEFGWAAGALHTP